MAQLYKSITTADTHELIAKSETIRTSSSSIHMISICNNSDNAATNIHVNLWDGSGDVYYICRNVTIPSGVTLILDDIPILRFDSRKYKLRISNAGTAPDLTVIIK